MDFLDRISYHKLPCQVSIHLRRSIDREQFELMKDEYYLLRGLDVDSGLQKASKLYELDLEDVALELRKGNLVR